MASMDARRTRKGQSPKSKAPPSKKPRAGRLFANGSNPVRNTAQGVTLLREASQVLEDVGDFLTSFLSVVDGDVLSLLGAEGGIAPNCFASVHRGVARNFEGFLGAISSLYSDGFRTLANIFDRAFRGMDRFVAEPLDGMGGFFRAFASRMDDDVAAFFANEVGSLCGILEAVDCGFVGELDSFNGAVGGLDGNCFCSGVDFFDGAGNDMSRILGVRRRNSEARHDDHKDCPGLDLKNTGSHGPSLDWRPTGRPRS